MRKANDATVVSTLRNLNQATEVFRGTTNYDQQLLVKDIIGDLSRGVASYNELTAAKALLEDLRSIDRLDAAAGRPTNFEQLGQAIVDGVKQMIREQGRLTTITETARQDARDF